MRADHSRDSVILASEAEPGQYMCVRTASPFGFMIRLFTQSQYDHAFIVLGPHQVAEATIRGVRVDALAKYAGHLAIASTDALTPQQQAKVCATARSFAGREYNWRDIAILALRRAGARWGWLLRAADDRDALICSELVAVAGMSATPPLDWMCSKAAPEYVTPADLASRPGTVPVAWD